MSSTDPRHAEAPSATDEERPEGEAIRHDIERVREDLGETINALSEKADVKAQASGKAVPVVAVAIAFVVALWIVRRLRRTT
jgi:hypothetical protein